MNSTNIYEEFIKDPRRAELLKHEEAAFLLEEIEAMQRKLAAIRLNARLDALREVEHILMWKCEAARHQEKRLLSEGRDADFHSAEALAYEDAIATISRLRERSAAKESTNAE